jgi:uncharacterized protein (DUF427 family)
MALSKAYAEHPEHVLRFDADAVTAKVRVGGRIVAETDRALRLHEGRYASVLYFPREDVNMECLRRIEHSTHCPFKGDASYFDYSDGSIETPRIAWSYEEPFDQMSAIRNHLAFYPDRVTIETA